MDATPALEDAQPSAAKSAADNGVQPALLAGWLVVGGVDRPLYVGTNAIGRQSGDDIQNQHLVEDLREEYCGSVLQLAGRGVSSKHAVIYVEDERCLVQDLGSHNGTFLIRGGTIIKIPPGERYDVQSGEVLVFGDVKCPLHIGPGAPVAVSTADLVVDTDTQRLGPPAARQPLAMTGVAASAAALGKERVRTKRSRATRQHGSGAAGQPSAAATAADDRHDPAPAAAPTVTPASPAQAPGSRQASCCTECPTHPTLGSSSSDGADGGLRAKRWRHSDTASAVGVPGGVEGRPAAAAELNDPVRAADAGGAPDKGAVPTAGAVRDPLDASPQPLQPQVPEQQQQQQQQQQQHAGSRPSTQSSPACSTATPPPAENRAARSPAPSNPAAPNAVTGPTASGSSRRKRKVGDAGSPTAEPGAGQAARSVSSHGEQAAAQQACGRSSAPPPANRPHVSDAPLGHPEAEPANAATNSQRRKPTRNESEHAAPAARVTRQQTRAAARLKGAASGRQVVVRFSKNVGEPLKKQARQKVLRLGGAVTEDEYGFTHLVCLSKTSGGSGFQKSFAALWALAQGAPIVTEVWVEASARAGSFVPPAAPGSNFLLVDKPAEKEHNFDLAVAYQRAQQGLLLTDPHGQPIPVFLTPGLLKAEKDKGHGLKELISAAGGSVAAALSQDFSEHGGIALGNEKQAADEKRWAKSNAGAAGGTPLFGRSKLVAAIMRQEFDRSSDPICVL